MHAFRKCATRSDSAWRHNVSWNQDSEQDRRAQEAVRRLLQAGADRRRRGADRAAQQPRSAGDLREPRRCAGRPGRGRLARQPGVLAHRCTPAMPGASPKPPIVQDFVGLLSLSARKKVGEAAADRVTLEVANTRRRSRTAGAGAVLHGRRRRTGARARAAGGRRHRSRGGAGRASARSGQLEPARSVAAAGVLCANAARSGAGGGAARLRP